MTHEQDLRVSTDDVRGVGDFDDLNDAELTGFIEDAEVIIESTIENEVSAHILPTIEKYLAAHFAAVKDRSAAISDSTVGETRFKYEGDTDRPGLESTRFGQQAIALDTSGLLAGSDSGREHVIETVNAQED